MSDAPEQEITTLAGGCFWCLEAVFEQMVGVTAVTSGYMGGYTVSPTYDEVCSGRTGHAEVVQILFDPVRAGFQDILSVFFAIHDPTTVNRQGNDVGSQYRSAIFYHSAAQQAVAQETIATLTRDQVFDAPIVTEVVPAAAFYPAEGYHQRYFARNPSQPYCTYIVAPKVAKFRKQFTARLKPTI